MALVIQQKKTDDVPEDAVKLTEHQALLYQNKIIEKWDKYGEVAMLRAGPGLLGSMSAISGFVINNHYRNKLKLGSYGRFSTYLPIVVIPAMMTTILHKMSIQSKIVLRNYDCPICLQTRATLCQVGFGMIYPFALAPFACFMYATRHFTYRLPSIFQEPKEVFKIWQKMTKSGSTMACFILAVNIVGSMIITGREIYEYENIHRTMIDIQRNIENGA